MLGLPSKRTQEARSTFALRHTLVLALLQVHNHCGAP